MNMSYNKELILGDIHGRTCWKDIIKKEQPDHVIFLGDYVTTHEHVSAEQQVQNFNDILDYKMKHPDTIMLTGNHDCQMMGYPWAEMTGWDAHLYHLLKEDYFKDKMLEFAQIAYVDDNIIYSHAGISDYWLKQVVCLEKPEDVCNLSPNELFGYNYLTGYGEGYGNSISQSPIWIRPIALTKSVLNGYTQVVGHTPIERIVNIKDINPECAENIYLCDKLPDQYLIRENNQFIVKNNG